MLKKAKAESAGSSLDQAKELSQTVLNSSHQIWLAGLGAFARAQQEGMKLFETLVRQGEQLESTTRQVAVDTATAARGAASAKAREVQKMAGGTWDKLEQVFEDRVARALSKLGVYTQNDVQRLAERVDALSEAVNRLINAPAGAAPRARASRGRVSATATQGTGSGRSGRATKTGKGATSAKTGAKKRAGRRAAKSGS